MSIFVSYRREQTADITGRICDRLTQQGLKVFLDVDSIQPGMDFRRHLHDQVRRADVVLAVIGPGWVTERLRQPEDWVRIEIESALHARVPVIPVLVRGAMMPKSGELPVSLRSLTDRHAARVDSDHDFHHHVSRLLVAIDRIQLQSERQDESLRAWPVDEQEAIEDRTLVKPVHFEEDEIATATTRVTAEANSHAVPSLIDRLIMEDLGRPAPPERDSAPEPPHPLPPGPAKHEPPPSRAKRRPVSLFRGTTRLALWLIVLASASIALFQLQRDGGDKAPPGRTKAKQGAPPTLTAMPASLRESAPIPDRADPYSGEPDMVISADDLNPATVADDELVSQRAPRRQTRIEASPYKAATTPTTTTNSAPRNPEAIDQFLRAPSWKPDTGMLHIISRTPADVFVDGKLVGNTPGFSARLAPGRHKVNLLNPELMLAKSLTVDIQAGLETTQIVDFDDLSE